MSFRHLRNVRGFFSEYYLGSVFGRETGRGRRKGLSDRDSDLAYARLRKVIERATGDLADPAIARERVIRPLLRDVLGFHLGAGDNRVHGLWPTAEAEAAGENPIVLAYCGAAEEDLDAGRGQANPTHRLHSALARADLRWGLLVTPERVRLVRPEGEGPRGAYLEADVAGLAESDDPESFAAFRRLLSSSSFVPGPDGLVPIDTIERESRRHAEKVSDDLKRAVFEAAEALVGGLLADAEARGLVADAAALPDEAVRAYRDAALVALYRILFILYAEARDERLDEHAVYKQAYSIHALRDDLLADPLRPWPENRSGLWQRLLATFRIFDEGLPKISQYDNIPARGGDFFDATTPEGGLLAAARLPDRTVARLLLDLTTTAGQHGIGRELISFRELDIEQLGAVYEGLLEFEPRVARATTLEVRVQGKTFALAPAELERLVREKGLALKGDIAVVADTTAQALHPDAPAPEDEASEDAEPDDDEDDAEDEGGNDGDEEGKGDKGVKKGAPCLLLRRLEPGDFHFVPSAARKGSGSFYTPLPLVRDLVRHAVGPQLEGRTAAEIESLRVLDPACGSGHFLVEAMRVMGRALHRAYVDELDGKAPEHFRPTSPQGWDADWRASDEQARAANSEARAWCKRRIAERCLFGVDLNPTAVALARVALWIESLAGDRPLTYFEHHVRCGNSLLGTWLDRLGHPPLPSLGAPPAPGQANFVADAVRERLARAAETRRIIDETAPAALLRQGLDPESVAELDFKERQRREAEAILAEAKLLFDLRSASAFVPELWEALAGIAPALDAFAGGELAAFIEEQRQAWWRRPESKRGPRNPWDELERVRQRERFFHWELEFPEVLLAKERPGFDAVLGNPPWDKVLPTKLEFYGRFDILIRAYAGADLDRRIHELHREQPELAGQFGAYRDRATVIARVLRQGGDFPHSEARSQAAHEDVSKYFVDRALRLIRENGAAGLVVPSVVYNGDGCVGIRRFLLNGATIERFYGFENREKIFPIHSSYKFVSLVARRRPSPDGAFTACFMRHALAELEDDAPKPWQVRITRDEIERLSPETLAFLEYRSPRDQEIVHRMHEGRPTLGSDEPGSWGARFISWRQHEMIFNSAEDKDLFTDASGKLATPEKVLGAEPGSVAETIEKMRERGYWPVFEGKSIDQWLVGTKPIRWWLSVERAEAKYGRKPRAEATLVFRETASNTNERTCIAAIIPVHSAASHRLTGMLLGGVDSAAGACVLNSFCFDYALRKRTAGTNISFTYMRPTPVPAADVVNRLPGIQTRLAWESGLTHTTGDESLWPLLWDTNRAVAEAYGLGPADLAHILDSFPGVKKKRPAFFAYLQSRLAEWAAER